MAFTGKAPGSVRIFRVCSAAVQPAAKRRNDDRKNADPFTPATS
jgi:hypothetical protein